MIILIQAITEVQIDRDSTPVSRNDKNDEDSNFTLDIVTLDLVKSLSYNMVSK
jgi:hypothetical protein